MLTLEAAVRAIAETAVDRQAAWDALDAAMGDGDLGTTVARGFSVVLERWDSLDREAPRAFLVGVAEILAGEMGGTSGPLWSVAFLRAGAAAGDRPLAGTASVVAMLEHATAGIRDYGGADVGDKTLLDALCPAVDALRRQGDAAAAARAAVEGARGTRELPARRGRGSYLGERSIGAIDPGAAALAVLAGRLAELGGTEPIDVGDLERAAPSPGGESEDARPARAAATKSFVNRPEDLPRQAMVGLARAHPGLLTWDDAARVVSRAAPRPDRVGLVSGGGSGHEPLHAGFVGPGMLTAVAPGGIFASPTVTQVLAATRAADAGRGVLHIVKNYTGDVINFRLAAELAGEAGHDVASVVVADDVASAEAGAGRRGTGATVFVEKIAGALAEAGAPLVEVQRVAARVAAASASVGVALAPCSVPGGEPLFDLGPDEIEIGIGIHGELGVRRDRWRPAHEIVDELLTMVLDGLEGDPAAPLLALVNGMGGTPAIELYLLYDEVSRNVADRGRKIARSLVGSYVTSLDMAAASITLLALDDELLSLWDAPVVTPALRWGT